LAPPLLGLEETVRVDNEVVKMEDGKQNRVQTSGQWLGGLVEEGRGRERLEVPLVGLDYGVKVHCTGKIFLKVVPRALENLKTRFVINCKKKKKKKEYLKEDIVLKLDQQVGHFGSQEVQLMEIIANLGDRPLLQFRALCTNK